MNSHWAVLYFRTTDKRRHLKGEIAWLVVEF